MNIVWFSEIKWNYLKTRKQQIISRKPSGVDLLYLEPYVRSSRNPFGLRREGEIRCAMVPFLKSAPHLPWRAVLDHGIARRAVDAAARMRVVQILKSLGFHAADTGVIISNVYAANIVSEIGRKFLLYDCNDDHSSFPGMRPWTGDYFRKTLREADAVFASSEALLRKVVDARGGASGCSYLGNGVDYDHFQRNAGQADAQAGGAKARLGYIGAVAPWFDFDAVADLARRRPQWEIVLVGPVLLGVEERVRALTSLPNVYHLPAVSYDKLPGVLAQFAVGLIPFRYNDLTRGVNPNKMYEYLACGLPVVTTRFSAEVGKFPGVVSAVDPGEGFVRACEDFIDILRTGDESAALAQRARRIARENDWNVIASEFWSEVTRLMNRP
jgi:glycosyltransferase involved in cell wall biosynthesis